MQMRKFFLRIVHLTRKPLTAQLPWDERDVCIGTPVANKVLAIFQPVVQDLGDAADLVDVTVYGEGNFLGSGVGEPP